MNATEVAAMQARILQLETGLDRSNTAADNVWILSMAYVHLLRVFSALRHNR